MFHDVPPPIATRMAELERIDARDRRDGTPQSERLRQIPRTTAKLLALLAAGAPLGNFLEIGSSAGYSTLWLALAARAAGATITTFELLPAKAQLAQETFAQTGVTDVVRLVQGDARHHLPSYAKVAFCFLDAEKDVYGDCYEAVVPNLVRGGLLAADNALSHEEELRPFVQRAERDRRVDALVIPIDRGLLLCRKS